MRFFEVMVDLENVIEDEEKREKALSSQKTALCKRADVLLMEYDSRAGIFCSELDKSATLVVCINDEKLKLEEVVDEFLKGIDLGVKSFSVKELCMHAYFNELRSAYRNRMIRDDDQFAETFDLYEFYANRCDFFNDKVADDKKTVAELKSSVEENHLGKEYEEELLRVLGRKKRAKFVGNPANYLMISKDATARRVMTRDLISALYLRGRLQSKRYTIIDLGDRDCSLYTLETFYALNEGGTVLLKVSERNFADGEHSRGCVDMKKVCELVKKKGAKTLTLFSMDFASDKIRARLENYMMGVPLLVFIDPTYRKEEAVKVLQSLAAAEGFTLSQEIVDKVRKSDRSYLNTELVEVYNAWRAEYIGTEVFPEYRPFVTHVTEEEMQRREGNAYEELQQMIGLKEAKTIIDGAINYFKLQKEYRNRGIEFNRPAMHMSFTGSPGTAKTSVARLVAEILRDNGILSEGKLVEVGRAQLVGEYLGHTAPRVREAFDKAKGSVLFIDEAYSLVDDKKGLYGSEAINTIVQEMENRRDDTIVILAGYPEEMNQLLDWNPGMRSRIAFHVPFQDYTEKELLDITKLIAKKQGLFIDSGAEDKLLSIYADARLDKGFGNGRFARNLVEKAKFNQANRMSKKDLQFVSNEELRTLSAEDFVYEKKAEAKVRKLGFAE